MSVVPFEPGRSSARYAHAVAADIRVVDELEAAFVDGEDDALRRVYDTYGALVHTLCRRALGADAASDATQEVFVAAWQRRHQFDPKRGSLAGWLVGIARNKAIDVLRSRSRRPQLGAVGDVSAGDAGPVDLEASTVDDLADRLLLADALAQLPPRTRSVVELAFFEDLTHPEIAARANLPIGTVKSDIRRGLQRLRRHLGTGEVAP
jgi:RNA polymerase sigma factor (sigma-70 family)